MIGNLLKVVRAPRTDVLLCAGKTYSLIAVALNLILRRECPPSVAEISNDLVITGLRQSRERAAEIKRTARRLSMRRSGGHHC
jgi:hypothetical protein